MTFPIAILFALAAASSSQDPAGAPQPWIGKPAPPFELPTIGGGKVSLSSFAGNKVVVLHFAASW
jgi:hypothetical protein